MATQVLEGTWEEISKHAKRLTGKQLRVTIISIIDPESQTKRKPNEGMLEVLRKVQERQKGMRETGGESAVDIIRRGRAGEMYGYDPDE